MKLIKPTFEIIEQGAGLQGIYDIIENAGKTSYKSEVKGGEIAKSFVEERIKEGHLAVLEFGTVYLQLPASTGPGVIHFYSENPYSRCFSIVDRNGLKHFVTTNYRVIIENNRTSDLQYLCDMPKPEHLKRVCVRFIIDRFTGEEFLRHRVFSFCRESTRFCNYSKDKFDNNITFILPPWYDSATTIDQLTWKSALSTTEQKYMELINVAHWRPEQARTILPCAIKSPLVMCGYIKDWKHFFDLRVLGITGKPHPQAKEVAEPLMKEFERKGLI